MNSIYETVKGDELVYDKNYPLEINEYLKCEIDTLKELINSFNVIVEVGCMDGLHMDLIVDNEKFYVGIDIIQRYIDKAIQKSESKNYKEKTLLLCEDATNLGNIQKKLLKLGFNKNQILYFFPFNSFGNMKDVEEIVDEINQNNLNIFISTYDTNNFSIKCREEYYANCNFKNTVEIVEQNGIRFVSDDGLNAIAYKKEWLYNKFETNKNKLISKALANVGIAYIRTNKE